MRISEAIEKPSGEMIFFTFINPSERRNSNAS